MKFEIGKYYRTREGRRAYVVAVGHEHARSMEYPIVGYVFDGEGDAESHAWTLGGQFCTGEEDEVDLVGPWAEPPWDYTPKIGEHVWAWHESCSTYQGFCLTKQDLEREQGEGVLFAKMIPPDPPKF